MACVDAAGSVSADDVARCGVAGCQLPRLMGQVVCIEHKPKPLTFRESVAAGGPRFQGEPGACVTCVAASEVDKSTGLCVDCFRPWRFGAGRKS